jgi:hypothetical protein
MKTMTSMERWSRTTHWSVSQFDYLERWWSRTTHQPHATPLAFLRRLMKKEEEEKKKERHVVKSRRKEK